MHIQILYFAYFRERIGLSEESLDIDSEATIQQLIEELGRKHQCIDAMQGKFRVARNQEFASFDTVLSDGDEIALIPPVAGGCDSHYVRVLDTPLSLDRVVSAVSSEGMGGIVTFLGQVRDRNEGHDVVRLEYEAYGEMAVKVMTGLCQAIEKEIPGSRLAVEHRVGVLGIGDAAVVIAAAAPHRAQAFEACRTLIDRLKEHVPIWKKETAPDGEEWIGMGP